MVEASWVTSQSQELTLCTGVYFARVGNIKAHQINMQLLYGLALILTGLFTLLPNRVMGQIFFGA